MVKIIGYRQRQKEDGNFFFVLELQGGIEMSISKSSGKFYATAKKAYLPSTFDEATCKALLGTDIQGCIIKEECEPYSYIVKDTGEEITLSHRYIYTLDEVDSLLDKVSNTVNNELISNDVLELI